MLKPLFALFLCVFLLFPRLVTLAQSTASATLPVRQVKLSHFDMLSSAVVKAGGDSLSSVHYNPADYWFPVTVPSTVLTGLVANKVYPDPYIGLNNMLIPDASDTFNQE